MIRQYANRQVLNEQNIAKMSESVKLSAKIKFNHDGKVYRLASYIDESREGIVKTETNEPSLVGCLDSCSDAYHYSVVTLIFCCQNEEEQRNIEHASFEFIDECLCVWSITWKEFVFVYKLDTSTTKKHCYKTLKR